MNKRLWPYGKKGSPTRLDQNPQPVESSSNIYRSIVDLPLSKFIDCQVNNNLYALVITGVPDPVELHAAWIDIQQEYADAIGDNETKSYILLQKEIAQAELDFSFIQNLASALENAHPYSDENTIQIGKHLNRLCRMNFAFDVNDPVAYFREIQRCLNRSRSLLIKIDMAKASLQEKQKKFEGKEQKPTKEYYIKILIAISNHIKYNLALDEVTVFEFCERLSEYNKYCEHLNRQAR